MKRVLESDTEEDQYDTEEDLRNLQSFDSFKSDNYYNPKYKERWKDKDELKKTYARYMNMNLIIEAKQDPERP